MDTAKRAPPWIGEIDFLRGFAILGVVLIHSSGFGATGSSFAAASTPNPAVLMALVAKAITFFSVPLFLLISGFALMHTYGSNFSVSDFYKKRLRSILVPYIIFSLFYLLFDGARQYFAVGVWPLLTPVDVFWKLAFGKSFFHLWFVSVILQLYIVYPVLARGYAMFKAKGKTEIFLMAFLFSQVCWVLLFLPYGGQMVFGCVFYFVLGFYCADNYEAILNRIRRMKTQTVLIPWLALALTVTVLLFDYYFVNRANLFEPLSRVILLVPVFNLIAFGLLVKATLLIETGESLLRKALYELGAYSFGIYLVHAFFREMVLGALSWASIAADTFIFYVILFTVTLLASYLAVRAVYSLPFGELILGRVRVGK